MRLEGNYGRSGKTRYCEHWEGRPLVRQLKSVLEGAGKRGSFLS